MRAVVLLIEREVENHTESVDYLEKGIREFQIEFGNPPSLSVVLMDRTACFSVVLMRACPNRSSFQRQMLLELPTLLWPEALPPRQTVGNGQKRSRQARRNPGFISELWNTERGCLNRGTPRGERLHSTASCWVGLLVGELLPD
jgi:hypothetical protein